MMEDHVQQVKRVLCTSPSCHSNADKQLTLDLLTQYEKFCNNFFHDTDMNQENHFLLKSLGYLERLHCDRKGKVTSKTGERQNSEPIFVLNGKPLQFKVLKNKPKNGDFKRRWNRYFDLLKEFGQRYGHMNVTRSTKYAELGNWVAEQRRKLKRGKLTLEQFERLNEIGFEWDRSYYFHNSFDKKENYEIKLC